MMNHIEFGDCRETMKRWAAQGVKAQMCVTSPPYFGLRSYLPDQHPDKALEIGLEETPDQYIARMVDVFRCVRDVLTDDGTLWLNIGDSYNSIGGVHSGRDDNQSGVGAAKRQWREGSARADGEVRSDGMSRRNRNGTHAPGLKPKDLIGIPWRLAFALRDDGCADIAAVRQIERVRTDLVAAYAESAVPDRVLAVLERLHREYAEAKGTSWYLRQDIIWHKPNPMPESVRDRCTKAHEYIFLLSKSEKYFYDAEAILEPVSPNTHARLSQNLQAQIRSARANGGGKTNGNMKAVGRRQVNPGNGIDAGVIARKFDPGAGNKNNESFDAAMAIMPDKRNKRSVWTVTTKPYKGAHFATYPPALIEPCILAGSRPGDTVLDCFMGSGTTAAVALQHGRQYLGCELNAENGPLQHERISDVVGPLFVHAAA